MKHKLSRNFGLSLHWLLVHPSEVFVILAVIFGALISLRLAPLSGTDEFTHFPRAYQVLQGEAWSDKLPDNQYGGKLPAQVKQMVDEYRDLSRKGTDREYADRKTELNSKYGELKEPGSNKETLAFTSTAVYPPWAYAPAVGGIAAARAMHLPLNWYVYLARLCTLAVWILLTWLAIRALPEGKWFLVAVALLPTSLTQALTVGMDGLVMGLSWVTIALVLAAIAHKPDITKRALLALFIAAVLLSVTKQGYILVSLWPLIIPREYFSTDRVRRVWKFLLASVVVSANVSFPMFKRAITTTTVLTPRPNAYINSTEQLQYVIHQPFLFAWRMLSQPFTKSYDTVYIGLVGILTNRLIYLSIMVVVLLYISMFLSFHYTHFVPKLAEYRHRLRMSAFVVGVGTFLFITLALYISFTQVKWPVVEGVTGRYFLPLLPLFLVVPLTREPKFKTAGNTFALYILFFILAGLISATIALA
jgi:uncharacterized membrane protein